MGRYEKPEKKNYHVVNSFTLLLARLELWKASPKPPLATSADFVDERLVDACELCYKTHAKKIHHH